VLKLTTDRHEASRGSIATAELLVISALPFLSLPLSLSISACAQAAVSFSFGRQNAPFFACKTGS